MAEPEPKRNWDTVFRAWVKSRRWTNSPALVARLVDVYLATDDGSLVWDMLDNGFNVNTTTADGTPLIHAKFLADQEHHQFEDALYSTFMHRSVDKNIRDRNGNTVLFCFRKGDAEYIRRWVEMFFFYGVNFTLENNALQVAFEFYDAPNSTVDSVVRKHACHSILAKGAQAYFKARSPESQLSYLREKGGSELGAMGFVLTTSVKVAEYMLNELHMDPNDELPFYNIVKSMWVRCPVLHVIMQQPDNVQHLDVVKALLRAPTVRTNCVNELNQTLLFRVEDIPRRFVRETASYVRAVLAANVDVYTEDTDNFLDILELCDDRSAKLEKYVKAATLIRAHIARAFRKATRTLVEHTDASDIYRTNYTKLAVLQDKSVKTCFVACVINCFLCVPVLRHYTTRMLNRVLQADPSYLLTAPSKASIQKYIFQVFHDRVCDYRNQSILPTDVDVRFAKLLSQPLTTGGFQAYVFAEFLHALYMRVTVHAYWHVASTPAFRARHFAAIARMSLQELHTSVLLITYRQDELMSRSMFDDFVLVACFALTATHVVLGFLCDNGEPAVFDSLGGEQLSDWIVNQSHFVTRSGIYLHRHFVAQNSAFVPCVTPKRAPKPSAAPVNEPIMLRASLRETAEPVATQLKDVRKRPAMYPLRIPARKVKSRRSRPRSR